MTEKSRAGDKIAVYKWTRDDKQGVMMSVDKKLLSVDPSYQRDENHTKTLEIASKWSWIACGVIIVGMRENSFFVIDGQHRVAAALKRSDIQDMPCIVFETSGCQEEAAGFLQSNTNRRQIGSLARLKASIAAGDDDAIAVSAAIENAGLVIAASANRYPQIKCVTMCSYLARQDFRAFVRVLNLASALARDAGAVVHERLLCGLFEIDKKMKGGISDRFAKRALHVKYAPLIDGIHRACAFHARGSARTFAEGILIEINKGLREKFDIYGSES